MSYISDRLRDEADLCRIEMAEDIAKLLDEAAEHVDALDMQLAQEIAKKAPPMKPEDLSK